MFCQACGQSVAPGATACAHCGKAIQGQAPPAPFPYPSPFAVVEHRINTLAYAWIAFAVLQAVFGFAGLAIARAFLGFHLNQGFGPGFGPHFGPHLPFFFLRLAQGAIFVRIALSALAGYGLLHKAAWGRVVAIVAGVLCLFHPILGTALGIWTLVVLLNRENTVGYEAMS